MRDPAKADAGEIGPPHTRISRNVGRPRPIGEGWSVGGWTLGLLALTLLFVGCHRGPKVVPMEGRVSYNGKPLTFGTVMLQPRQGQAAVGDIQSDGSFRLSTFKKHDGAIVGRHKIRVACYESQRRAQPAIGEQTLGKLLIPERYTFFDQSGLAVEVLVKDNPPLVLELKDG